MLAGPILIFQGLLVTKIDTGPVPPGAPVLLAFWDRRSTRHMLRGGYCPTHWAAPFWRYTDPAHCALIGLFYRDLCPLFS
jgi:hypothetical protein